MKLTDIKKLKVAELRSRLEELGLDNKGLKAELFGRLWSALEAGHGAKDEDEQVKRHADRSLTPTAPAGSTDGRSSPPRGAGVTERCKPDCTNSATQTGSSLTSQQRDSESVSEAGPDPAEGRDADMQRGGAEDPGEGRRAPSPEEEGRRAPSPEEEGRGRAFYEFKEETRYKRYHERDLSL